jgi:hypothetical protein
MSAAALIDTPFITIYAPFSRPASFILLQWAVVGCGVLTFVHALRQHRAGDSRSLFAWATIATYGVLMELLSYNVFKNFTHGQMPVMFYHHQLPLYVIAVYPVFIYSSLKTVERFGLGRWAEPAATGLVIVALDAPFDILGPGAGWWSWSATDPNISVRWLDVPVNSYCFHLFFGGTLVFLCRLVSRYVRDLSGGRLWRIVLAFPVAVLTIVGGIALFVPVHVVNDRGVPQSTIVAALLALCGAVFAGARQKDGAKPDVLLLAVPVVFYGFQVLAALTFLAMHDLTRGGEKLGAVAVAIAFGITVQVRAQWRRLVTAAAG